MNVGHDVNLADTDSLGARIPASERSRPSGPPRPAANGRPPRPAGTPPPEKPHLTVDPVSLVQPAMRRWPWLLLGAVAGGVIGLAIASHLWHITYTATAQMVRYDPPVATDAFRPRPVDVPTLIGRLEDPAFLRRVGQQLSPAMSSGEVLGHMRVLPERNSGIMNVIASGSDAGKTTELANAFARETVKFTQEDQSQEATEADGYVAQDLSEAEKQLAEAQKNMPTLAPGSSASTLDAGGAADTEQDRYSERIQAAKDELAKLLARYTDAHPLVRQQRALIAALEAEQATGVKAATVKSTPSDATAGTGHARVVSRDEYEVALFRLRQLESLRMQLLYRRQQIDLFKANPPGSFRITVPASGETLSIHRPWLKIGLVGIICGVLGLTLTAGQLLVREFMDSRLKTADDVTRVTGLPVVASLGDLRQMSMAAREDWAFRTWIALQDRLSFSPNHGLICGITSSRPGDGRSTWVGLLAGAARKCGFRVLTIATKPTADGAVNAEERAAANATAEAAEAAARRAGANGHAAPAAAAAAAGAPVATARTTTPTAIIRPPSHEPLRTVSADTEFTAMTASALFTPAQVTEKLMGPESDPLVHIPLPGWTWNLERRKQWQGALNVWRKIENVVILVELPPASVPEAVLLASNLPNILWMVESGKSEAIETRAQLQTLRHARCNIVGAVINRAMSTFTQGRLSRWMNCLALVTALGIAGTSLMAQEPSATPAPADTFSIVSPAQRAAWQRHLTLGPGDVLTLSIYGEPDLTLKQVPIGPDGRISYLEAHDVMAAGLTVDELRDRLNQELGKYRREPQVIIVPDAYKSKKYYVLGTVTDRGVFTLDRPTTLLEAVARARGLETGMSSDQNLVELADLSRSFIARNGHKLPVDFEKLFADGDLSQNIALEPNDYIYFPAAQVKEVYVLGAVERPGTYSYLTTTGAIGAVAARGGFTEEAWRNRLLVIRGSLQHPQLFVVDAKDVLSARAPDLTLQPHDIVFVSKRPWLRPEELLDEAASAFVTSAVVMWTGLHVDTQLHR
ncbi:MAG TPA: polysaccharide biosynthesis/export family protein [Opitutaceae bacterium]|nr:polysaccharide biosynthesis/export family protein [Opitutaceae bacterium]